MKNLNLLFNKHYFSGIEKSGSKEGKKEFLGELKKRNQKICGVLFSEADYLDLDEKVSPKDHRFLMKTSYPGLLVGTGYAHEAEAGSDDCIKLGFSFDYVSGQPYVPGSSVKGMLRSCFKEGVTREVLKEGLGIAEAKLTPENLKALETNIFEGNDIFFDSVLRSGDKDGYVMAQDYITPHKGETKAPTPLMMIKVRPGVVFEFRFKLYDFKSEGRIENERLTVSAVQKKELFQILIELFGVGAKTNVGYGTLIPLDELPQITAQIRDSGTASISEQPAQNPRPAQNNAQNTPVRTNGRHPQIGDELKAEIIKILDKGAIAKLCIDPDITGFIHISEIANHYIQNVGDELWVGQIVTVKVIQPYKEGKNSFSIKQALQ